LVSRDEVKAYVENYIVRSFTNFALYFGLLGKKLRLCGGISDIRCGSTPYNNMCGRIFAIVATVRRKSGCHEVLCKTGSPKIQEGVNVFEGFK
jgi:hypothetical protein